MKRPRVLVTGPVGELDEWCRAADRAGWEGLAWPLIRIEEHAPDAQLVRALAASLPTQLCVTSAHAVAFLEALAQRLPALRALSCAVVGQRSAGKLRALGFQGEILCHASAEALRDELCARQPKPVRVLWPRGDRSDELARALRGAGIEVADPLAYSNRPRAAEEQPPECELVFLASPSAVEVWAELRTESAPARALAIGSTTFQALLAEKRLSFFDIISLPEPTSGAFTIALMHIDLSATP